jgi:dipeptidyl aminopeptidase/acylaminoacyl peptidase
MCRRFRIRVAAVLLLAAALAAQAPSKRPITHKDFDPWRTISAVTLSPDGKYLAYAYMPQAGDGDLVVREVATGREWRENVGELPPPPVTPVDTEEPPPPPPSIRIAFTSDSRWLAASTYPRKEEMDKARQQRRRAEEMPKQGLLLMKLGQGEVTRIERVKSFQIPLRGGAWIAYLKEAPPAPAANQAKPAAEAKPGEQDEDDGEDQQVRAAGAGAARQTYGTDLVLRELDRTEDPERVFAFVSEYSFARDGKTLVYAVNSRKEEDNGVYAYTPGAPGEPVALKAGKGKYSKLAWDRGQRRLAFFEEKTAVWVWDRGAAAAAAAVTRQTPGLPPGMQVSEKGTLQFSADGQHLFVPVAPPQEERPEAETAQQDMTGRVLMDLWHWRDGLVQPMQRVRANRERNRTYRGVWHLDEQRYVQLATPEMAELNPALTGLRALGMDDRPYRQMIDYDGAYMDVYSVDTRTGTRRPLARMVRGGGPGGGGWQISPDGEFAAYFNSRSWFLVRLSDGAARNATGALPVAFHREDHDTPSEPPSYGAAGWSKDSRSFLVYDRYDIWQLFVDGSAPRNVTGGAGRRAKIALRLQRIDPPAEEEEPGIDTARPLTLTGESEETRETGFFRVPAGGGEPQRLLWGAKQFRYVTRARDANVLAITAQRFDEYPDVHLTDSDFRSPQRVTRGGGQMEPFLWGTAELIRYKNADGVPLAAALYKPANFDPKKKYPMMVYIYEKLSQNVHSFVHPRPGHNFNFSQYVSDGYLVLTPDIVYTEGQPGQSALKCVLAAVQAVESMGFVDPARIGIAGHSWGGYQVAYMVTQTTRFRAAEAGAPVGNMTSAYSGIRWGSGMPRQFQYEKTQSRIGKPLYEDPLKYIENSPVFHIKRVTTPLLILHDDNDDAVPWYQGIELFLALRRNGKEAYLMNYNGELHGLRRRHNQMDYAIRMKQFFDHFLKDAPKPEWMEKGIPFLEREQEKERFRKAAGIE